MLRNPTAESFFGIIKVLGTFNLQSRQQDARHNHRSAGVAVLIPVLYLLWKSRKLS